MCAAADPGAVHGGVGQRPAESEEEQAGVEIKRGHGTGHRLRGPYGGNAENGVYHTHRGHRRRAAGHSRNGRRRRHSSPKGSRAKLVRQNDDDEERRSVPSVGGGVLLRFDVDRMGSIKCTEPIGTDRVVSVESRNSVDVTMSFYAIKSLQVFAGTGHGSGGDTCFIGLSNEQPSRIKVQLGDESSLCLYVAPKIVEE